MSAIPSGMDWRLGNVESRQKDFERDLRVERERGAKHQQLLEGENGVLAVMHELKEEMGNVRKALYTAAGGAVFSAVSIGIAIAVYAH